MNYRLRVDLSKFAATTTFGANIKNFVSTKSKSGHTTRAIYLNKIYGLRFPKFLGGKWVATGPEGLVPFNSQKERRAYLKWPMLDHCYSC